MSQENNDKLVHISGNAGDSPQTTDSGRVNVSVAVTLRYGREDGETRWVKVWIKDPALQQFAKEEISKGSKVAAVGFLNISEYNGKTQYNLNATEIGIVKWAQRNGSKPAEKKEAAASEELGW